MAAPATGNRITEGVIWKELLRFTAPLLLGNLFQQLYNTVDSVIVGRFIGTHALAAVGSSFPIINMIIGFFMGAGAGAGVVLAQNYGASDKEETHKTVHTMFALMTLCGIAVTVLGYVLTPWIIRAISTPKEVEGFSILYLRIIFLGSTFLVLYNTAGGALRSVGDSKRPLYYLIVASVLNIILDLLFVVVFHWGIAGAAAATVTAIAVSAVLSILAMMRTDDIYRLRLRDLRIHGATLRQIIRIGLPMGIQQTIISFSNTIVQRYFNIYGAAAVAGVGAYNKVDGLIIMPVMSLSLAATTFVGQNIGAKKYHRVRVTARAVYLMSTICSVVLSLVVWAMLGPILHVFTDDTEAIAYGMQYAYWLLPAYVVLGFAQCAGNIIRGSGQSFMPMFISVMNFCVIRVIWLVVSGTLFPSLDAVCAGYPLTWLTAAIMMAVYYFRGNWLRRFTEEQNE
ncbi:MAG: MATE family efflux transporter [Eubacterium sp.]|nr:MATE family efflux transporter [Eubacterium sp.]